AVPGAPRPFRPPLPALPAVAARGRSGRPGRRGGDLRMAHRQHLARVDRHAAPAGDRQRAVSDLQSQARSILDAMDLPWGKHSEPMVRGNTFAVEFSSADDGHPFSVDIIELRDGKIQSLRAYTGWRALAK